MIEKKNTMDAYNYYKSQDNKPIPLTVYRAIINGFIKYIIKLVLAGNDVQMSTNNTLGNISISGVKHKGIVTEDGDVIGLPPDWGTSRKLWQKKAEEMGISFKEYLATVTNKPMVYHTNEATDGYTYSFKWSLYNVKLTNKFYYHLRFSRANKRAVKPAIKSGAEYLHRDRL